MNSPTLCSLFCVIMLCANIQENHCQNNLEANSLLQQVRSDHGMKSTYLDKILLVLSSLMGKLETANELLADVTERQTKTEKILTGVMKRQNKTDVKLAEIVHHFLFISNATVVPIEKDINGTEDISPEPTTTELSSTSSERDFVKFTKKQENSFKQEESPFSLDATTLSGGRGAIVFDGSENSAQKKRFWVIEKAGTVKFTLEENELKPESRLTITGFHMYGHKSDESYVDSSTANGTEFTVSGTVVIVTMSSNETTLASWFALRFLCVRNDSVLVLWPGRNFFPSSFVMGEGRQVASFPWNNERNYANMANQLTLIYRKSGREFNLRRTFVDIKEYPDYCNLFGLEDEERQTRFNHKSVVVGRHGRINKYLGRYSAAVLWFTSDSGDTGKGYQVTID